MSYRVKNGKIQSEHCDLNIVHHCNLSCKACNHASSRQAKIFTDPEKLFTDLLLLGRYYQPERIYLLGGEPLLHPRLLDVVDAVRNSGICRRIRILTNGVLLHRMPEYLWRRIDQIHVSVYPGFEPAPAKRDHFEKLAKQHSVDLHYQYYDFFRETFSELGHTDPSLVARIFKTCRSVHDYKCHTLENGHFFRCSQSAFFPRIMRGNNGPIDHNIDGLNLAAGKRVLDDLLGFLNSDHPLFTCRHCLGSAGRIFPQKQVPRHLVYPPRSMEALLDWRRLRYLEKEGRKEGAAIASKGWGLSKKVWAKTPHRIRSHPALTTLRFAIRKLFPGSY
jgi:organic radical activating enzyme